MLNSSLVVLFCILLAIWTVQRREPTLTRALLRTVHTRLRPLSRTERLLHAESDAIWDAYRQAGLR